MDAQRLDQEQRVREDEKRKRTDIGVASDGIRDVDRPGLKLGRFFLLVVGSTTVGSVDKYVQEDDRHERMEQTAGAS